jgi:hypothetical protein
MVLHLGGCEKFHPLGELPLTPIPNRPEERIDFTQSSSGTSFAA